MSTISDALRVAGGFDILVDIDFDSMQLKVAGRNISVLSSTGSPHLYKARLMERPEINMSYDFRSGSYSLGSISLEIANRDRIQDYETRVTVDGRIATIRLWCEGLTWEDIETAGILFRGVVSKRFHTRSLYSCTVEDPQYASLKTIPIASINATSWPDHATVGEDAVSGKFIPFVFGDTAYVPLLCIDTANFYFAAAHGVSKTVDADFDSTEHIYCVETGAAQDHGGFTWQQFTDPSGNVCSGAAFVADPITADPKLSPLYCSMRGLTDPDGTITGAAGTLLQHPAEIAYYLLRKVSGLGTAYIDAQSFSALKNGLPGYLFASYISESINVGDMIDRLFAQSLCSRVQRLGKIAAVMIPTDADTIGAIPSYAPIADSVSISKSPDDLIVNNLLVQYAYDPVAGLFRSTTAYDRRNDDSCNRSYVTYGERPQYKFELPDVQDDATATACAARLLALKSQRHDIAEIEVPYWIGWDYVEGDTVRISLAEGQSADGAGWVDEPCVLIERQLLGRTIRQTWWRIATD